MKEIKSNSYSVFIGDEVLTKLKSQLESGKQYSKVFILVDENTLKYCLTKLITQVEALKDADIIEVESGEKNKCIEVVTQVWITLSESEATRKALLINLGGGVISDMGGFIASTYKRGIDFINVPTTLLSQVDASVGGKLGIDLDGLKNQIGVFNYPQGVFILPEFLETLPANQLRSGFAEVIKHALINDNKYWDYIKSIDLKAKNDWTEVINWSVEIKNEVVLADPKEAGLRKILNYGHTIGHAIETFSIERLDQKDLLHGEAIAIGMIAELYLSTKKAGLSGAEAAEVASCISNIFMCQPLDPAFFDAYVALMMHDKKNEDNSINFTLLKRIGLGEVNYSAEKEEIIEALKYYNTVVS